METKRKNREWSENSKVIEGIFRKPAKLLQKEKKQVAQLLDEKFPRMNPLEKRQISRYLKYLISSISLL
jgi:predicted Mrr-cat superfamily restriction endonuclease